MDNLVKNTVSEVKDTAEQLVEGQINESNELNTTSVIENDNTIINEVKEDVQEVVEVVDNTVLEQPEVEPKIETKVELEVKTIDAESVSKMFEELNNKFDQKIAVDTYKNQLFDKMYGELNDYKDDLHRKIVKPIFMDIISFADQMERLMSRYKETPDVEELLGQYQKLRKEFGEIRNHINDILYNYDIESFVSEKGDEFNSRIHQSKRNEVTTIKEDHKKIYCSMLAGYTWNDKLLRREAISINICEDTNKEIPADNYENNIDNK